MARGIRWQTLRRAWAIAGSIAMVGFFLWMGLGYRASATARAALVSDDAVVVTEGEGLWRFEPVAAMAPGMAGPSVPGASPAGDRRRTGLIFFPGALVDPRAYAPLLREVAAAGYPAVLLRVPWRGAFGSADRAELRGRARQIKEADAEVETWVVGGHSRGAKVAAMLARDGAPGLAAVALIGSTHPRDFSLAGLRIPVLKIYGTRDGVAPPDDVLDNAHLLPATTRWVRIEGANHGQFGWYGLQPFDRFAQISRTEQQAQTVAAMRTLLVGIREGIDAGQ